LLSAGLSCPALCVGARMKVSIATEQSDGFLEAYQLERKMVRKVPKDLTRKWLSTAQARKLLDQLGARRQPRSALT
jgi:hypothetical protein